MLRTQLSPTNAGLKIVILAPWHVRLFSAVIDCFKLSEAEIVVSPNVSLGQFTLMIGADSLKRIHKSSGVVNSGLKN